jgi:sugar (pentulose or hexulose) kinase
VKLEDARVVAACSHDLAASVVGLPIEGAENWAFLRSGPSAIMGTELDQPVINDASREWNFTNEAGYGGTFNFYKHVMGLSILEECRKFWKEKDRELDADVLLHLAISAPPFESLINLADPRFREPGDMPLKIQAYCRETNQTIVKKPGPTARCVLESLALHYRQTLCEMEYLTGRKFSRLYLFGSATNSLLNHFTSNAMQIPVVLVPYDTAAVGNMVVQAMALGHVKLFDQARDIVKNSNKADTIVPHPTEWDAASNRLAELATA